MNHLDKSKAALESCDGRPVNETTDMALVAIANALVAIAEQEPTLEPIEGESRWHDASGGGCVMEYGGNVTEATAKAMGVYFCSECGSPNYNDCMPCYCIYCGKETKR